MSSVVKPTAPDAEVEFLSELGLTPDEIELERLTARLQANLPPVEVLLAELPKIREQIFLETYGEEFVQEIKRAWEEAQAAQ